MEQRIEYKQVYDFYRVLLAEGQMMKDRGYELSHIVNPDIYRSIEKNNNNIAVYKNGIVIAYVNNNPVYSYNGMISSPIKSYLDIKNPYDMVAKYGIYKFSCYSIYKKKFDDFYVYSLVCHIPNKNVYNSIFDNVYRPFSDSLDLPSEIVSNVFIQSESFKPSIQDIGKFNNHQSFNHVEMLVNPTVHAFSPSEINAIVSEDAPSYIKEQELENKNLPLIFTDDVLVKWYNIDKNGLMETVSLIEDTSKTYNLRKVVINTDL